MVISQFETSRTDGLPPCPLHPAANLHRAMFTPTATSESIHATIRLQIDESVPKEPTDGFLAADQLIWM